MNGPQAAPSLLDRVRGLVHRACSVYGGGPAMPELLATAHRLDEPLRVAIAGRIKAGKSTMLNALVGQELAATDAGECTRVVTWYRDGHTYRIGAQLADGRRIGLPSTPAGGPDMQGLGSADVDHIVVDWPSPTLRAMTLVDTPGIGSLSAELSARTTSALTPDDEDGPGKVDAVVYLMRHMHATDVSFLETFRGESTERRPINTLAVLGRADEVGHGRPEALESAVRIAARYREDPRVRSLCQTVLPVAGLLAATGATLREDEFRAIGMLASAPAEESDRLLLTANRFVGAPTPLDLPPARRAALHDRFGMFGLRCSVDLLRTGTATTAGALSGELLQRSGLIPFREALTHRFAARSDVLKARSALRAVDAVLRRYPFPPAEPLVHEVEQLTAGAHEFAEIRLMDSLRTTRLMLTPAERDAAERLLGGDGVHPAARLGVDPAAGPDETGAAARAALAAWQRRAEHPSSNREVREACRVLVRTCEALVLGAHGGVPAPRYPTGDAGPAMVSRGMANRS